MEPVFEDVCAVLSSRAQIPLTLREQVVWGGPFPTLRPTELEDEPSFSIVLVQSRFKVEAHFVPDTFSGAIVQTMGSNLDIDISGWSNYIRSLDSQVSVLVRVNNEIANLDSLPVTPWQRLEIECSSPFVADAVRNSRRNAFIEVATACLVLALLALDGGSGSEESSADYISEGSALQSRVTRYERSAVNRLRCIAHWGTRCWVCEFDFSEFYGQLGEGFIEVHHVVPLARYDGPTEVDPVTDLVPLCSNCHSMIHRGRQLDPPHPNELRSLLGLAPRA